MKISTTTVLGILFGAAISLIGMGQVGVFSSREVEIVHQYGWWIVVLSMLVPLADYLTGARTTLVGVLTGHPFRHWAGFFSGLAVGLGLLLLLWPGSPAWPL